MATVGVIPVARQQVSCCYTQWYLPTLKNFNGYQANVTDLWGIIYWRRFPLAGLLFPVIMRTMDLVVQLEANWNTNKCIRKHNRRKYICLVSRAFDKNSSSLRCDQGRMDIWSHPLVNMVNCQHLHLALAISPTALSVGLHVCNQVSVRFIPFD